MQTITKITDTSFSMVWDEVPTEKLVIDFKDIIEQHRLTGNYCLLHWQAKPKGLRKWGVYDSAAKSYHSMQANNLLMAVVPRLIEVDENIYKTVPSSTLYFPNSIIVEPYINIGYYTIKNG